MNDNRWQVPAGIVGAVLLLGVVIYLMAPALQSAQAKVDSAVAEHVERARRTLNRYDSGLERLNGTYARLKAAQVNLTLADDRIGTLLDQNPELLTAANEQLRQATANWPQRPAGLPGGAAARAAVRSGQQTQREKLEAQAKLLDETLAELKAGLDVRRGDVSGETNVAARTLEAAILLQQGAAAQRKAAGLRDQADAPRVALAGAAHEAAAIAASAQRVAPSGIEAQISAAQKHAQELHGRIDQLTRDVAKLDQQIAGLQSRIAERKAAADKARDEMEHMEEAGADLTDAAAAKTFETRYSAASRDFNQAAAEAAMLERGTLLNAAIDESGDYLSGAYRPTAGGAVTPDRGLAGLLRDRSDAQAELTGRKEALVAAEARVAGMRELREHWIAAAGEDAKRIDKLKADARPAFDELSRLVSEAESAEKTAIEKLKASLAAATAAANAASGAVNDAATRVQALSDEARPRATASVIQTDTWIPAQRQAQKADAQIEIGRVYLQAYLDAAHDAQLLAEVRDVLGLREINLEAYATKRDEAQKAGADALEAAITQLESAFRPLKEHWSVRAEIAGATYLLSLFGDPDGVLRDTAIANYQSAVEGREDNPSAAAYVQRLRQLTAR